MLFIKNRISIIFLQNYLIQINNKLITMKKINVKSKKITKDTKYMKKLYNH